MPLPCPQFHRWIFSQQTFLLLVRSWTEESFHILTVWLSCCNLSWTLPARWCPQFGNRLKLLPWLGLRVRSSCFSSLPPVFSFSTPSGSNWPSPVPFFVHKLFSPFGRSLVDRNHFAIIRHGFEFASGHFEPKFRKFNCKKPINKHSLPSNQTNQFY